MRSSTNSNNSYSPSVPLSVYRELATELQATKAKLDSLNAQNQQLAQKNQQLRQEIEKVVQHVLHLQRVVDSAVVNKADVYHPDRNFRPQPSRPVPPPRSMHQGQQSSVNVYGAFPVGATGNNSSEKVFVKVEEVQADSYRRLKPEERVSEVSGWKLAIAILLVMFTAFGAGYFLVRPFLSSR